MSALPSALRVKLTKVCSRLASDHDGERAAAALLASRMLRDAGFGWEDALAPAVASARPTGLPPMPPDIAEALRRATEASARNPFASSMQHPDLRFLWENSDILTGDERVQLSARIRPSRSELTRRQAQLVAYLVERVRARLAGRAAA